MANEKKYPSQADEVYDYMVANPFITQAIAYEKFGCSRLSAIIYNMREAGLKIKTNIVYYTKWNGRPGRYAEYYLEFK